MLNENAKLWVEDLRKNGNLQGRRRLHLLTEEGEKFCCLGRACILYNQVNQNKLEISQKIEPELGTTMFYDDDAALLPEVVRNWLGLKSNGGAFFKNKEKFALSSLNDSGKSFLEIADIIESEPEGLFL